MTETKDLPAQFHDYMAAIIDEDGVSLPHALVVDAKGGLVVMALDLTPDQTYRVVLGEVAKGAREAIFALDRFTKPGQGTKYADVLAGHHFILADTESAIEMFRPFVIEYRHNPRVVEPIDWDNAFWNGVLKRELLQVAANVLREPVAEARPA